MSKVLESIENAKPVTCNEQDNSINCKQSALSAFSTSSEVQSTLLESKSTQHCINSTEIDKKPKTPSQRETAELVIGMIRGEIVYHSESGEWYTRKGNIMEMIDADGVNPFIIKALDKIQSGRYSYSQVTSVKNFVRDLSRVERFEDSRNLLPLSNGVLNLCSKTVESYKNYNFNWVLPYFYQPASKCPAILRYLVTTTGGDRDMISFLLAWLRVLVAGEFSIQKYVEIVGAGGTGKSTFIELCSLLVGEKNCVVTDLKTLENNRFESANLQDKRLVIISEAGHYSGDVSVLKAITGGDVIRSERKNKQAGRGFKFKGLLMMATNEQVQSSDYTSGLARRKIPIIFNTKVSEKEKSRYKLSIVAQMRKELPGLLNILLRIELSDAVDVVKNPEGTLAKIKQQNELATNPILAWMNENLIRCCPGSESYIGSGSKKTASQADIVEAQKTKLYPNYQGWCEEQGKHPVAINRFPDLILDNATSHGIETAKNRRSEGNYFTGLRLRTISDIPTLLLENADHSTENAGNADQTPANAGNVDNAGSLQRSQLQANERGFIL